MGPFSDLTKFSQNLCLSTDTHKVSTGTGMVSTDTRLVSTGTQTHCQNWFKIYVSKALGPEYRYSAHEYRYSTREYRYSWLEYRYSHQMPIWSSYYLGEYRYSYIEYRYLGPKLNSDFNRRLSNDLRLTPKLMYL